MLLQLVKKDFLIVKKYVLLMFLVCLVIPPFMLWRVPQYAGAMGFVLSGIFASFMLFQYSSMKECQYPKAAALLCAAPYPRKYLVLSKYIFCLIIYVACCGIFWAETLVLPGLGGFHAVLPALLFFVLAVFFGIYLPVQYKLGYEKTKFIFILVIMATPFLLPQLLKLNHSAGPAPWSVVPAPVLCGAAFLLGLALLAVSALISIRLYARTDLA